MNTRTTQPPVMLAVAPNGARRTHTDHPAIPLSPVELATTAAACQAAGASLLHLHVRDATGQHSLDAGRYREAIAAIRREAGDDLVIQITTEAVGRYHPEQQMQAVREVRPEAVSLAIRELCPEASAEKLAGEFFHWLYREHIAPQYILYSVADVLRCNDLQARGVIPGDSIQVLLVLGRYTEQQHSDPAALDPLLAVMNPGNSWSLCAFGSTEATCMQQAIVRGGHCRVGFENNLLLPDGSVAEDNAALVALVASQASQAGRPVATAAETRKRFGLD